MVLLDPLDRELFQRACDAVRSVLKADELDSDEKLEAALRCELLTIALLNGMSDPERYLDTAFAGFSERDQVKVSRGASWRFQVVSKSMIAPARKATDL